MTPTFMVLADSVNVTAALQKRLLSVCFKSVKKLRKAKMPVFWQ